MSTEEQVEDIIRVILDYRQQGIKDNDEILAKLKHKYQQYDIDFEWFLEMMSRGSFRASMVMSGKKFPKSNIDDDIVLKTAFKMFWIEHKGEKDYYKNFKHKKKKWWQIFK